MDRTHAADLCALRKRLEVINEEYRRLVRKAGDDARLARMSELGRLRLELTTAILELERAYPSLRAG